MIASLTQTPLANPVPLLSEDRLRSLAQTYNRAESPVWIHNLQGECIYTNPRAERLKPDPTTMVFDILDHHGRLIGRLKTLSN